VPVVKNFINSKGGTKNCAVYFVISSDYLKLRIDIDVTLLDYSEGHLSTNVMDFFRLWFMHKHLSFYDLYITTPICGTLSRIGEKKKGSLSIMSLSLSAKKFSYLQQ
jgi:hypothetical protein